MKKFFFVRFTLILLQQDSFKQYLGSHTVQKGPRFFAKTCIMAVQENSQNLKNPNIYGSKKSKKTH